MPHIALPDGLPGITAAFDFRPETARPMRELAHVLLHLPNSLAAEERELIATYVSSLNDCYFCATSHAAAASAHLGSKDIAEKVMREPATAPVSAKLKALLRIAGKVQRSGKDVTKEDVAAARAEGATDMEIHDTVLIAATFCMFNRYVDGLATVQPDDPAMYAAMGAHLASKGYRESSRPGDDRSADRQVAMGGEIFKTRALAAEACEMGRVEANGTRAKAAREVHAGDLLLVRLDAVEFHVEVLELSRTRGPASAAQKLYRETEASREARLKAAEERRQLHALGEGSEGRPSKRDRRQINRLRGRVHRFGE